MRRTRTLVLASAAAAALVCAAPAAAGGGGPQYKTVKVFDNYFLPATLKVNKGSTVTWKWPSDIVIGVHDVKLKSGPDGVRKFHSEPASFDYKFRRTLKKPGLYKIVCTFHRTEMQMQIRVRRY